MSVPQHGVSHLLAVKNSSGVAFTDADSVREFELSAEREQIERYEIGNPDPQQLVSGKKSFAGSWVWDWTSGNYSAISVTLLAALEAGTEVWVGIYPEGDAAPYFRADNAKLENWTLRGGIDGLLENEISYKALGITVG